MEVSECTKIVFSKIKKYDPENAIRIIGYLLLHYTSQDVVEFACGTDVQIISLIREAKSFPSFPNRNLGNFTHHHHAAAAAVPEAALSRSFSSPSPSSLRFRVPAAAAAAAAYHCNSQLPLVLQSQGQGQGQSQSQHADEFQTNLSYPGAALSGGPSPVGGYELPAAKACQYYHKGFCKHGANCWYLHGESSASANASRGSSNDFGFNEEVPFVLERLEMEIRELLKSRSGLPLSIAALPLFYYDKYGKALQADGYLTESQRHGKSGFSLTKLLARLNNGIQLIHGQNGQHMVILAEDAHKYVGNKSDRYHQGGVNASSNQIYLTFPAESTFTDEDVENYFKQYGPVHDVRIPHQEKRMFGFVSFMYPETVRHILAKGNPHYICGSRVLVKPYKEKSKLIDRKNAEKSMFSSNSLSRFFEIDQNPTSRVCEIFKKQLIDEREFEIESKSLFDLQLTPNKPAQELFFGSGMEELNYVEDRFSNLSIVPKNLDIGGKNDHMTRQISSNRNENNTVEIDLPESPFTSPQ